MTIADVRGAAAEARRFLGRVEAPEGKMQHDTPMPSNASIYEHPRETGALRRSSLDLTRALAQMRRRY